MLVKQFFSAVIALFFFFCSSALAVTIATTHTNLSVVNRTNHPLTVTWQSLGSRITTTGLDERESGKFVVPAHGHYSGIDFQAVWYNYVHRDGHDKYTPELIFYLNDGKQGHIHLQGENIADCRTYMGCVDTGKYHWKIDAQGVGVATKTAGDGVSDLRYLTIEVQ